MQPSSDTETIPQNAVGPGSLPAQRIDIPSILDGVSEYEWVDLFNPLSVTFMAQVASTRPANVPLKVYQTPGLQSGIKTEADLAAMYGLTGFKNPDHPSNVHVPHILEIPAGATRRFPGNEAQVILKQLVGHLLQVEGHGLKLADPHERHQAEERIVRGRGNIQDMMDAAPVSVRDQLQAAVDKNNAEREVKPHEPETEFPEITGNGPAGGPGAIAADHAGQSDSGNSSSPK